ncbi:MAG: hypothetical protein SVV03_06080 [Candidatus Nanohaloarchaea archaeon]|nr:hypothetical protein [Candidatus Nanohaloarchaea archaeon]
MDRDIKYLLITVGILVAVAAVHNYALDSGDEGRLGYCQSEIRCAGFNAGGMCLGVEQLKYSCTAPSNSEEYRRIEVECAVQAYNLCEEGYTGKEWAKNATYRGKTCRQWKQEKPEMNVISCNQAFPSIEEWDELK